MRFLTDFVGLQLKMAAPIVFVDLLKLELARLDLTESISFKSNLLNAFLIDSENSVRFDSKSKVQIPIG